MRWTEIASELDESPRAGVIMSDLEQTPQGNDFWRARFSDAAAMGLRVGVVKFSQKDVRWFDPAAAIGQWLRAPLVHTDVARWSAISY